MITKITNHVEDAQNRLADQFQEKPRIAALLKGFTNEAQFVENALIQLLSFRSVSTAIGRQLDIIGSIIGERRSGRKDFEYRRAIYIKIAINVSKGTPEEAIDIFSLVTESTETQLEEYWPGHVTLMGNVDFRYGYEYLGPDSFAFEGGVDGLGFGDFFDPDVGGVFVGLIVYDMHSLYVLFDRILAAGVKLDWIGFFTGPSFSFDGDARGAGFGNYFDSGIGGNFATIVPDA